MTTPTQGEHAQTEALRLAESIERMDALTWYQRDELRKAAAELRRLHAYAQELESQVIADCMTHDAQPAAPQGVAYADMPEPKYQMGGRGHSDAAMRDFADRTHALRAANGQAPAGAAEIEALRALSVTNIMIDVVPGDDGMGHEVYAKSVDDVVNKLTAMGAELEDWQLGIRRHEHSPTAQAAPAAHVQNPAEIEHVEADVSKNGVESNMAQQGAPKYSIEHVLWVLAEHNALHFGGNHSTVMQARQALTTLRTQQPTQAQAGAVPLTDEQIGAVADGMPGGSGGFLKTWGWYQFARAVERAHGIKGVDHA